jgi:hypothetical protein
LLHSEKRWLKPTLVAQFEFVEWTSDNHLRHSSFIALRDDKKPTEVVCFCSSQLPKRLRGVAWVLSAALVLVIVPVLDTICGPYWH